MTNTVKIILLIVIIIAVIIGLIIYLQGSQGVKEESALKDGSIISIPNRPRKTLPVVIIYGGIPPYGGQWMRKQIPQDILDHNVVVIASSHNTNYAQLTTDMKAYLANRGLNPGPISLIAFSGSGKTIQDLYSPSYRFFGLIDPNTHDRGAKQSYGSNTYMIYNVNNWPASQYQTIRPLLPVLAQNVNASGGTADQVSARHLDIPKLFLETYADKINKKLI